MEVHDYQSMDQYSHEQVWCPCQLLALMPHLCVLLNHIGCAALDGKIPLFTFTGIIPDISIILLSTFYQPVFYATHFQHFPSENEEWEWVLGSILVMP